MAKTNHSPRYAATLYDSAGKRTVWLILHPEQLEIVDDDNVEFWPLSNVYAGQMGQGEAECISNSAYPDLRLFVAPSFLDALKAACRGEPYTMPRTWHIRIGPVLLFGFLGVCVLIWYVYR